ATPGLIAAFARAGLTVACGLLAASANDDENATPSFALAALLLAETMRRAGSAFFVDFRWAWVNVGLLGFAAQVVVLSGGSVAFAAVWHYRRAPEMPADTRIDAPSLRTLYLPPTDAERQAGPEALL